MKSSSSFRMHAKLPYETIWIEIRWWLMMMARKFFLSLIWKCAVSCHRLHKTQQHIKQPKLNQEEHEKDRKRKRRSCRSHSMAIVLTISMDRAFFFSFPHRHHLSSLPSNIDFLIVFAVCYVCFMDLHHNSNFKLCQEIDENKKWHERHLILAMFWFWNF